MTKNTSWGTVAGQYSEHLKKENTYHESVIAPQLVRLIKPVGKSILEVGCGEGFITRVLHDAGAKVTGADISPELISLARKQSKEIHYEVAPAQKMTFAQNESFDVVLIVLALQNMDSIDAVFTECRRIVKQSGRLILVLNHPMFRIPKHSSWEYDGKNAQQYRRIDQYLTQSREDIVMNPGSKGKLITTPSFHRSLQDIVKPLSKAGFAITNLEEWISHRESQPGPKAQAENKARKEFPLFMTLVCKKIS